MLADQTERRAPEPRLPDWPLFGWADDIRPALRQAAARDGPAVLATLIEVRGGGPRPAGAQMLFWGDEAFGYLSGGCVEADVAGHARRCARDGIPRRLVYGQDGPWPDIQLLCGARIELLVERLAAGDAAVRALLALTAERRPALWRTDGTMRSAGQADGSEPICAVAATPFEVRRRFDPASRLLVVGGDPTALAIAQLGLQAGFETHLIRPKGPEQPPPIAGLAYSRLEPEQAFAALGLDPWTFVAVATHDWIADEAAVIAALRSSAAYVGVLGARRRLPERLQRLRASGLDEAQIRRLSAPIGLDLGGKAPWEVAVAVLAEIVARRSMG
jgi:xanthine dehydrogenase accessory factor